MHFNINSGEYDGTQKFLWRKYEFIIEKNQDVIDGDHEKINGDHDLIFFKTFFNQSSLCLLDLNK